MCWSWTWSIVQTSASRKRERGFPGKTHHSAHYGEKIQSGQSAWFPGAELDPQKSPSDIASLLTLSQFYLRVKWYIEICYDIIQKLSKYDISQTGEKHS